METTTFTAEMPTADSFEKFIKTAFEAVKLSIYERIPGDGERLDLVTNTGAFIVTHEQKLHPSGTLIREHIYVIRHKNDNLWETFPIRETGSSGPYMRLLLRKIDRGILNYEVSGRGAGSFYYPIIKKGIGYKIKSFFSRKWPLLLKLGLILGFLVGMYYWVSSSI